MQVPKELSSCVNKALFRLSTGDMTSAEMLLYLTDPKRKNTGFEAAIAKRVVSLLEDEGFLDDKRYLKLLLRKMDRQHYGPRKIREVLVRHRFSASYVEAAMAREVDFSARALEYLKSRRGAVEMALTPAGRKKLMDAALRYGYDYSSARFAVERISDEDFSFSE